MAGVRRTEESAARENRLALARNISADLARNGGAVARPDAPAAQARLTPADVERQRKEAVLGGGGVAGQAQQIGSGAFSRVRLAVAADGQQMVVKTYEPEGLHNDAATLQHMRSELALAGKLSHPHIIAPRSVVRRGDHVEVEMEYAPGGSLSDLLKRVKYGPTGRLDEVHARRIFSQLVEAVAYLHANGVVHNDIKPPNVMFDGAGAARLIDFGNATRAAEVRDAILIGTPAYMPPEAFRPEPRDSRVGDVWSLGVLLVNLLSAGEFPFVGRDEDAIKHAICSAPPGIPDGVSAAGAELVRRLLTKAPKDRPAIGDVRADAWMRGAPAERQPPPSVAVAKELPAAGGRPRQQTRPW